MNCLDTTAHSRFGGGALRARITLCTNNLESAIMLYNCILANSSSTVCLRRPKWSSSCGDADCESCLLYLIDVTGLNKMYLFGVGGQSFLCQLPLFNRVECLVSGHGKVYWNDIDWEEFESRDFGKYTSRNVYF